MATSHTHEFRRYQPDSPRRVSLRLEKLFPEILKRISADNQDTFVNFRQTDPASGRTIELSHDPIDALENLITYSPRSRKQLGRRSVQIDAPIPQELALRSGASRIRAKLFAPPDRRTLFNYDLMTYRDASLHDTSPFHERIGLHVGQICHRFFVRSRRLESGHIPTETITVTQPSEDALFSTSMVTRTSLQDCTSLKKAYDESAFPSIDPLDKRLHDVGACLLAHSELFEQLTILTAMAGENPAHPMGVQ